MKTRKLSGILLSVFRANRHSEHLINVTVTTDAIDQRSRHTSEDQICQAIGIAAHSRLGCKDDASSHRHRFKFISLNLSFYITHYKIPIKTSVKYSVQ